MKKLLKNIDERVNVISAMKKAHNIKINNSYIYINAWILLALFVGIFLFTGKYTGLIYDIRYTFYAFMISIITVTIILSVLYEIRIQIKYELKYNPLIAQFKSITTISSHVFGFMAVVFILLIPGSSKTIDIVIVLALYLVSTTIQFLFGQNKNVLTVLKTLFDIFLLISLFIGAMYIVSVPLPWITLSIFTLYIMILLSLNLLLKRFVKQPIIHEISEVIFYIMFTIVIIVVLSSGVPKYFDSNYSHEFTYNYPLSKTRLNFPEAINITGFLESGEYYYLISQTTDNNKEGTFMIYSKDMKIIDAMDYSGYSSLIEAQGHDYFIITTSTSAKYYELKGNKINLLANYDTDISGVPMQIDGTYYIFPYYRSYYSQRADQHLAYLMSDPTKTLDLNKYTKDILYQDKSDIIMKIDNTGDYYIFDYTHMVNVFAYNNGIFMMVNPNTSQIAFKSPENLINDPNLDEYINVNYLGNINGFYYYKDSYYYLRENDLLKLDSNNDLTDTVFSSWPYTTYMNGSNLYLFNFLFDQSPVEKGNYNYVDVYDLNQIPFSFTGFVNFRDIPFTSQANPILITVFASIGTIFMLYKKSEKHYD